MALGAHRLPQRRPAVDRYAPCSTSRIRRDGRTRQRPSELRDQRTRLGEFPRPPLAEVHLAQPLDLRGARAHGGRPRLPRLSRLRIPARSGFDRRIAPAFERGLVLVAALHCLAGGRAAARAACPGAGAPRQKAANAASNASASSMRDSIAHRRAQYVSSRSRASTQPTARIAASTRPGPTSIPPPAKL